MAWLLEKSLQMWTTGDTVPLLALTGGGRFHLWTMQFRANANIIHVKRDVGSMTASITTTLQ